jgi:hypothetical protein
MWVRDAYVMISELILVGCCDVLGSGMAATTASDHVSATGAVAGSFDGCVFEVWPAPGARESLPKCGM